MRRLAATVFAVWGLLGGTAWAVEDVVLLGVGDLVADGEPALLHIWSPVTDTESRVKAKASVGRTTVLGSNRHGITTIQLQLPKLDSPTEVSLAVRVKTGDETAGGLLSLDASPPRHGPLALSFEPAELTVGVDTGVLVRLTAPPGPQSAEHRRFRLRASAGSVDDPIATGDGTFVARWTPPRRLDGSISVVFTVADAAAPDQLFATGRLPVLMKRTLDFKVEPGTNNILVVGQDRYGPHTASSSGKVSFEVMVDPRSPRGLLQTVGGSSQNVELALGAAPLLAFVPVPDGAPADAGEPIEIRVAAMNRDSTPHGGSPPTLTATAGSIEPLQATDIPGLFAATWTPPPAPAQVSFTATLGDDEIHTGLAMVAGLPRVVLESDPTELPKGARDVRYTATMTAPDGAALTTTAPVTVVAGGSQRARPSHMGDGTWAFSARKHSHEKKLVVVAEGPAVATGLPPARLIVWPAEGRIPVGEDRQTLVLVAALDAFGNPVSGVPVALSVPRGLGSVNAAATTNARGIAKVAFNATSAAGPGVIRAEAAGLVAEATVLVSDDEHGADGPVSGDAGTRAARKRWESVVAVSLVRVERPAPVVIVPPTPTPAVTDADTKTNTSASAGDEPAETDATDTAEPTETDAVAVSDERAATAPPPKLEGPAVASGGRVMFSLASVPHVYASNGTERGLVPESTAYENGNLLAGDPLGGLGGDVKALVWLKDLGLDLRGRVALESVDANNDSFDQLNWQAMAGTRFRYRVDDTLGVFGGIAAHRFGLDLYPYADATERADSERYSMDVYSGRVAVGFVVDAPRLFVDVELAESFVPFPVATHAGALVGYVLSDEIGIHLGVEFDYRTYKLEAWGDRIEVQEQEQAILLGATARIP